MKLENISGIDFEKFPQDEEYVKHLRHTVDSSVDFNQELLTRFYGDLFNGKSAKVLEIGCGWGRNAKFFSKMKNVKYFAFDPSPTSIDLFNKQKFPKNRFYVSNDIDETILSQKYDLIFSTYVLQHVGFSDNKEIYDSLSIVKTLWPTLKDDAHAFFYELTEGQNGWHTNTFMDKLKSLIRRNPIFIEETLLQGCDHPPHILIVYRK